MADTAFMNKAKQILRDNGCKLTGPRLAILDFMLENEKQYCVGEICSGLQKKFSGIGTATVYRNVSLFLRLGILRTFPTKNNQLCYLINRPGDRRHRMICIKCGALVEFSSCSFALIADEIEKTTRFEIYDHALDVYGLCPGCLGKQKCPAGDKKAAG